MASQQNVAAVPAGAQDFNPKVTNVVIRQEVTTIETTEAVVPNQTNGSAVQQVSERPKVTGESTGIAEPASPKHTTASAVQQAGDRPKTIGDALEDASRKAHDKPLELKDARAIQSAEAHATGIGTGVAGGPAAYAQHLLDTQTGATLGDALQDAKSYLPTDKVVTPRDVSGVTKAEARNHVVGTAALSPGGVAASMQAAAQYNVNKGFMPNSGRSQSSNA